MGALIAHRPIDDGEGLTVEAAERMLPDSVRYELHGGRIVVMSPAAQWHSIAQHRLLSVLERQGRVAGIEVGLRIAPGETRVLDVAVFHHEIDRERAYFAAGEIALAVEVVSPSSVDDDYIDKPTLYARLGIGEFWRVDRVDGELRVEMFTLDADKTVYVPADTTTLAALRAQ